MVIGGYACRIRTVVILSLLPSAQPIESYFCLSAAIKELLGKILDGVRPIQLLKAMRKVIKTLKAPLDADFHFSCVGQER